MSKLGPLLVEAGLVGPRDVETAAQVPGRRLGSVLIARGVVDADDVSRLLARQLGVEAALASDVIAPEAAAQRLIPEALCRELCAVPFRLRGGAGRAPALLVALRDPGDRAAVDRLAHAAGIAVEPRVAAEIVLRVAHDGGDALEILAPRPPGSGEAFRVRPQRMPYLVSTRRRATPPFGGHTVPTLTAIPAAVRPPPPTAWLRPAIRRLAVPVMVIGLLVWGALAVRDAMRPTSRAVGTVHHSPYLGLRMGFPEEAGWRVTSKRRLREDGLRAELYYRGGVPEIPHTGMLLARVAAPSPGDAAQRLMRRAVPDLMIGECAYSSIVPAGVTCIAAGSVLPENPLTTMRLLEAHAWPGAGDGDYIVALMIDPDHTLSEDQYILRSITPD